MVQINTLTKHTRAAGARAASCRRLRRASFQPVIGVVLILTWMIGPAAPVLVHAEDAEAQTVPTLRTADLLALVELAQKPFESVPDASRLNVERIVAF